LRTGTGRSGNFTVFRKGEHHEYCNEPIGGRQALRDSSRKFFMEVWRPAAIALDRMPRPEDVVAKGSVFWDVLKKTYELGYHRMGFPQLVGGMELDPMSVALVTEAMGYASPGLAVAWGAALRPTTTPCSRLTRRCRDGPKPSVKTPRPI
jgi:hypothetical protein